MYVLQLLVNGLLTGATYAVVGVGFSLVWGVMNVVNLAHGAFVVVGAFITYTLFRSLGLDPFLTIPAVAAAGFALGYLIQRYIINLIVKAPPFMTLVLTFGLSIFMVNLALRIWTANYQTVAPSYINQSLSLGALTIPYVRIGVLAVSLVLTGLLSWFLDRTKTGRAIKATRMDLEAAQMTGVRVGQVYAISFGIGAACAAVAGTLVSLTSPITPVMGGFYLGVAFVVCALGGLGDIRGALVGGLILGILETIATALFGVAYQAAFAYFILLLVFLVRPHGLIGREYY